MSAPKVKAHFIEPMLLLRTEQLPDGPEWLYEIKLDGYRALAIKSGGSVQLRSRNDNDFSERYRGIAEALAGLPNDTVIDGEVVALDASGKPSFQTLQNYGSADAPLHFYIFDVLIRSRTRSSKQNSQSQISTHGAAAGQRIERNAWLVNGQVVSDALIHGKAERSRRAPLGGNFPTRTGASRDSYALATDMQLANRR